MRLSLRFRSLGLAVWGAVSVACTAPNPAFQREAPLDAPVSADLGAPDLAADVTGLLDAASTPDAAPADLAAPPVDGTAVSSDLAVFFPDAPLAVDGPSAAGMDAAAADPFADLIGYWRFEDGTGETTAADSSKAASPGVLESLDVSTAWVAGKAGGGLQFPHDVANAGVQVPPSPAISALQSFTVVAWTYRTTYDSSRNMSIISRETTGDGEVFNLSLDRDVPKFWIQQPDGKTAAVVGTAVTNALDRWVHVAASYNGATMNVYVDGTLAGSGNYTGGLVASTAPLYLGTNKNPVSYNTPLEGILDEVQLYARALPAATIADLAAGRLPTP